MIPKNRVFRGVSEGTKTLQYPTVFWIPFSGDFWATMVYCLVGWTTWATILKTSSCAPS